MHLRFKLPILLNNKLCISYIICIDDEQTILDSLKIELETALEDEYIIETAETG